MARAALPVTEASVALDIYGLQIAVEGDWPEVVEDVFRDFAWFRATKPAGAPGLRVTVVRCRPDYERFANARSAFVTPRNVVYRHGDVAVVDYFGRALSVVDRAAGRVTIEGEDGDLVHEAAYQVLLSRIGEHVDSQGLVRLHALGLSGAQGAVAVMLPSGGGKSVLCLHALRDPACSLLSEDSPLIDRRGDVHPFPLRIGVNATDAALLPADSEARLLRRMEFHDKLALDVHAFADRVERRPRPLRHLVVGSRTLGKSPRLTRLPRRAAAGALLREAVVGIGTYQGMEFVLQRGLRDAFGKLDVAAARAVVATGALRRADVWRLELGRDHARNWQALRRLLVA